MISKHCGQPLEYWTGRFTSPQASYHSWRCGRCGRIFTQRIRLGIETVRLQVRRQALFHWHLHKLLDLELVPESEWRKALSPKATAHGAREKAPC